jgi:hypothetical protein
MQKLKRTTVVLAAVAALMALVVSNSAVAGPQDAGTAAKAKGKAKKCKKLKGKAKAKCLKKLKKQAAVAKPKPKPAPTTITAACISCAPFETHPISTGNGSPIVVDGHLSPDAAGGAPIKIHYQTDKDNPASAGDAFVNTDAGGHFRYEFTLTGEGGYTNVVTISYAGDATRLPSQQTLSVFIQN